VAKPVTARGHLLINQGLPVIRVLGTRIALCLRSIDKKNLREGFMPLMSSNMAVEHYVDFRDQRRLAS